MICSCSIYVHKLESKLDNMVALEPDPFLNELGKLFERNKKTGSLSVTMKRSKACLSVVEVAASVTVTGQTCGVAV